MKNDTPAYRAKCGDETGGAPASGSAPAVADGAAQCRDRPVVRQSLMQIQATPYAFSAIVPAASGL